MLHELLLALLGFTGDFVIDERECREALGLSPPQIPEGSPTFCLASDLSFIQPSERSVIEELLPLGFYYRELDHFAASSRNLSSLRWGKVSHLLHEPSNPSKDNPQKPSVYRRAIANGIVEILSLYRSTVLQVEQKLLSDPEPILASVTHGLNKFHLLLPSLHDLVMEIERDDIKGGKLLNLLNKRCHCGLPELQVCLKRLLWHGHQVMYNQLSAWMVYGILQDQHEEFFIRRDGSKGGGDENLSDALEKLTRISDASSVSDWDSGFHIYLDMLPEYIPMQVAEAILFSGKAVRVLRNPSPSFKSQGDVLHRPISKGMHGAQDFSTHGPEATTNGLCEEELLPQSEADKIEFMLQELKDASEFHKRSLERAIDSVRAIAASHLWQLVVIRADLKGHLKALKDYFLLAKGDFFHCFLEESRRLMRLPPRQATAEADLMVPFQLAAVKTISDEDKYFSRVSLRMPSVGVNTSQLDFSKLKVKMDGSPSISLGIASSKLPLDGWDGMALEYTVYWPLQFFFTPEVLSKYGKVFQYLIRLKRTQMELEKSWASVMHQGHYEFAKHQKDKHKFTLSQQHHQFSPVWRVREHMAFLIRNLHFYIQVDVIESQWNILLNRVQQSQDFSELVRFHQEYLSALISQSFLDIGSVSRILDCIMKLCLQFCWITESYGCNSNSSDLDQITEEFNKQSNSLYTILRSSRLGGSQRAPFLRRFLMRLNFNSFFESTAKDVINIVRTRPNIKVFE